MSPVERTRSGVAKVVYRSGSEGAGVHAGPRQNRPVFNKIGTPMREAGGGPFVGGVVVGILLSYCNLAGILVGVAVGIVIQDSQPTCFDLLKTAFARATGFAKPLLQDVVETHARSKAAHVAARAPMSSKEESARRLHASRPGTRPLPGQTSTPVQIEDEQGRVAAEYILLPLVRGRASRRGTASVHVRAAGPPQARQDQLPDARVPDVPVQRRRAVQPS
eukprot:7376991-Prymnesium_polylepis.1